MCYIPCDECKVRGQRDCSKCDYEIIAKELEVAEKRIKEFAGLVADLAPYINLPKE